MTKLTEIEAAALLLPDNERFKLADRLLGTLPPPAQASSPDEILAEAVRRDMELNSGIIEVLSEADFWANARRNRK